MSLALAAAIGAAYLIGSIPFGLLIARYGHGIDVRQHGSGNIGATNVGRVLGKKWGVFCLLLDFLKGCLPTLLLPRLVPAENVAVLCPTYGEHAPAWRKVGAAVREIEDLADLGDANVVVLVNPNNPDGRIVAQQTLVELAATLAARGGLLVVDEAFADFVPETSLLPILPEGALVLRSFGKAYGLAGLRLGFAVGEGRFTDALRAMLGPWAVAGPALHVGAVALGDAAWLSSAGDARAADSKRLDALLAPQGRVVGGTTLYRLLETPRAASLFETLGQAGIYVRRFQHDASHLRFGLPGSEAEWARLAKALVSA